MNDSVQTQLAPRRKVAQMCHSILNGITHDSCDMNDVPYRGRLSPALSLPRLITLCSQPLASCPCPPPSTLCACALDLACPCALPTAPCAHALQPAALQGQLEHPCCCALATAHRGPNYPALCCTSQCSALLPNPHRVPHWGVALCSSSPQAALYHAPRPCAGPVLPSQRNPMHGMR